MTIVIDSSSTKETYTHITISDSLKLWNGDDSVMYSVESISSILRLSSLHVQPALSIISFLSLSQQPRTATVVPGLVVL